MLNERTYRMLQSMSEKGQEQKSRTLVVGADMEDEYGQSSVRRGARSAYGRHGAHHQSAIYQM